MDGSLSNQEAVVFGMSLGQGDQLSAAFQDQVEVVFLIFLVDVAINTGSPLAILVKTKDSVGGQLLVFGMSLKEGGLHTCWL